MKKSSFIFLTILASLSLEVCSAQDTIPKPLSPPDTVIVDENDTVRNYYQPVTYNYYYRSRVWNSFFRICWPRRYYAIVNRPGYIPRHMRPYRGREVAHHSGKSSHKRGGFGRSGSSRTAAA